MLLKLECGKHSHTFHCETYYDDVILLKKTGSPTSELEIFYNLRAEWDESKKSAIVEFNSRSVGRAAWKSTKNITVLLPSYRPYSVVIQTEDAPELHEWLEQLFRLARVALKANPALSKNKIVAVLAQQVHAEFDVPVIACHQEIRCSVERIYTVTIYEHGCSAVLKKEDFWLLTDTSKPKLEPSRIDLSASTKNIKMLLKARFHSIHNEFESLLYFRSFCTSKTPKGTDNFYWEIGQQHPDFNVYWEQLRTIATVACAHPDIHKVRKDYHSGRSALEKLRSPKFPRRLGGKDMPGWSKVLTATLSSFSLADSVSGGPYQKAMVFISMVGGGVFNYLGGDEFAGFPVHSKDWTAKEIVCLVWGILSAVSPAVMTIFGVAAFGVPTWGIYTFGVLCGIANFVLSAALGYEGLTGIMETLHNFYKSAEYKSLAIAEITLYFILAWYLSSTRAYSGFKFMLCGPTATTCTVTSATSDTPSWKQWLSVGASSLFNVPELLLFVNSYLKLRMRITAAWRTGHYPNSYGEVISMAVAMVLGVSFFSSLKGVADTAWEDVFNRWFEGNRVLDKLSPLFRTDITSGGIANPANYSGVAAGLLVVGTGAALRAICAIIVEVFRCCGKSSDPSTLSEETESLLNSERGKNPTLFDGNKFYGSSKMLAALEALQAHNKSPWRITAFDRFNSWLVKSCGGSGPATL